MGGFRALATALSAEGADGGDGNETLRVLEAPVLDAEREAKKSKLKAIDVLSSLEQLQREVQRNQTLFAETQQQQQQQHGQQQHGQQPAGQPVLSHAGGLGSWRRSSSRSSLLRLGPALRKARAIRMQQGADVPEDEDEEEEDDDDDEDDEEEEDDDDEEEEEEEEEEEQEEEDEEGVGGDDEEVEEGAQAERRQKQGAAADAATPAAAATGAPKAADPKKAAKAAKAKAGADAKAAKAAKAADKAAAKAKKQEEKAAAKAAKAAAKEAARQEKKAIKAQLKAAKAAVSGKDSDDGDTTADEEPGEGFDEAGDDSDGSDWDWQSASEDEDEDGDEDGDEEEGGALDLDAAEAAATDDDDDDDGGDDAEGEDEEDKMAASLMDDKSLAELGALVADKAGAAGLSGWMQKKNKLGKWRLRFFAPAGRRLAYSVDKEQKQPKGFLDLGAMTHVELVAATAAAAAAAGGAASGGGGVDLPPAKNAKQLFDVVKVWTGGAGTPAPKSARVWTLRTPAGEGELWVARICRATTLARKADARAAGAGGGGGAAAWGHSGLLWKRNKAKRWKKRHFFIRDGALCWSKDAAGRALLGAVPLSSIGAVRYSRKTGSRSGELKTDAAEAWSTKVFKVVVEPKTPRERTIVLAAPSKKAEKKKKGKKGKKTAGAAAAAAAEEGEDGGDGQCEAWVEALLAACPSARLGADKTDEKEASAHFSWRKRKRLGKPYEVRRRRCPRSRRQPRPPLRLLRWKHFRLPTQSKRARFLRLFYFFAHDSFCAPFSCS